MPVSSFDLLTTKRGAVWACSLRRGDILGQAAEGVFVNDARHLSRLALKVDDERPIFLSCSEVSGHEATTRLAHRREIGITRSRSIDSALTERFEFRNYGAARTVVVELEVACDFADIFGIRGLAPAGAGSPEPRILAQGLHFEHRGRDGITRATEVALDPPAS